MNREQLKHRIVGAIVLVALGVIFIPMILNRDQGNNGITGSNIPPKPAELVELSQQPPPTPPASPAPPEQSQTLVEKATPALPKATETQAPSPAPAKTTAPSKPAEAGKTPKTSAAGKTWVVQVASLSDRGKALQLRDRLRKAKFTAFVEAVTGKRGTWYRVRVGPVLKREEADRLQARITRQLKIKGSLVMARP